MVSFWSLNRDAMLENNQGISSQYQFTNVCKKFGDGSKPTPGVNTKPVINGATDRTIFVSDNFDPLAGVTAFDKEDGILTSKIQVTGKVDTTKAGKYELTYKVVDSKGLEAIVKAVVEVKEKPPVSKDTYDSNKVYLKGDKVIYKGEEYTAKWWVRGENPDSSQAWEKKSTTNGDGSINYTPGMVFEGGQKASYEGKIYEAKWWTNSTPGSDDSWKLVK
jgi:chitinase